MKGWQQRGKAKDYMDTSTVDCQVCGKTIATRAWVVEKNGQETVFCNPDCERLYYDYWILKYGSKKEGSA